jgi:hypothetical protein
VFQIKNPRWADYWQQQAYPMMLVIRTVDGEIRWMDVSAYLKRESADGERHEFHELARMELVGKGGSKSASRASGLMR